MNDATLLRITTSLVAQLMEAESPEARIVVIEEITESCYDVQAAILLMLAEAIEPVFAQPVDTRSLS